jgi:hypothetical protein
VITEKVNYAINTAAEIGFDCVELPLLPKELEGEVHKKKHCAMQGLKQFPRWGCQKHFAYLKTL